MKLRKTVKSNVLAIFQTFETQLSVCTVGIGRHEILQLKVTVPKDSPSFYPQIENTNIEWVSELPHLHPFAVKRCTQRKLRNSFFCVDNKSVLMKISKLVPGMREKSIKLFPLFHQ